MGRSRGGLTTKIHALVDTCGQFGDLEQCSLRSGNVHSADDWEGVLKPVVVRYKGRKMRLYFRGDAAFASPEMYE